MAAKRGRPKKEIDKKTFLDLVGIGCTQEEICWFFRDDSGRSLSDETLSRWCKEQFGMNFSEYYRKNGAMEGKISLRRAQFHLAHKSAAMAIFLGKNLLGQKDKPEEGIDTEDTDAYFEKAGFDK